MKTTLLMAVILIGLSFNMVHGASNPFSNTSETAEEKKAAKDKARTLKTSGRACEISMQRERLDGAEYIAGVDVRGKEVVPADLASDHGFDFPDDIEFDLSLSPFQFSGRDDLDDLFPNSAFSVGTIKYSISQGQLTYNGKPLTGDQSGALTRACVAFEKLKSN